MIERKMFRDGIFKYFQHVHSPAHYTIQRTFQLKHSNNSTIMARTGFPLRCGVTGYLLKIGSSQRRWMIFCDIAVFLPLKPNWFHDEIMKQDPVNLECWHWSLGILPLNPVARVSMLLGNTTFENCRAQIGGAISSGGWCFGRNGPSTEGT